MLGEIARNLGLAAPILAVLTVLSLFSVGIIVAKVIGLAWVRSGSGTRLQAVEAWGRGARLQALDLLAPARAPADRVLAAAMGLIDTGIARPAAEAEAERLGNVEVADMARNIRALELIAMIAPLLGLLGTVLGMIESFQQLELAGGAANAAVLAGGIWQALITTAAGLLVAIPAAAAAAVFSSRVDAAAQDIEDAVGALMLMEDRLLGSDR